MKKTNREFKYSDGEIDGLVAWFEGRDLPKSLRIDEGTFIPDVAKCVRLLSEIVSHNRTYTFQPTADLLFKIKELCEREAS